jgi:arylformamidase
MTAIWRGYDQAALNAQFTLDTVTDREALFARRIAWSRQVRADVLHRTGIAYGPGPADRLDWFPATGMRRGAPILMYIHGGFWRSLDAATFSYLAAPFTAAGVNLAVIDYPLIPTVTLFDIVASCQRAVAWLHNNAAGLGAAGKLYVAGNSAGGHLTAMLADRAWTAAHGLPESAIAAACAISGIYELEPIRLCHEQETLKLTAEAVAGLSPLRHVPRAAAPTLFAVGAKETQEFLDQNREIAAAWRAAGLACEEMEVTGTNHVTVVLDGFARPGNMLHQAMLRMMGL